MISTHQNFNFIFYGGLDLLANSIIRALEVIPGVSAIVHKIEEAILHSNQLVILAIDFGYIYVGSGGTDVLKLISCKWNLIKDPSRLQSRSYQ